MPFYNKLSPAFAGLFFVNYSSFCCIFCIFETSGIGSEALKPFNYLLITKDRF